MPASNLLQPEFRQHARSGSLTLVAHPGLPQDTGSPMATAPPPRFDGPRSPPNTAHVPCKFFRQGACQAGNSCPFSHDIGAATETVCKYFAKGNCKFGPKCANIHVLPDGRRVNYGKNGVTIGSGPPLGLGNRINPAAYLPPSNSALTNSFLSAAAAGQPLPPQQQQQQQQQPPPPPPPPPASQPDDRYHSLGRQPSIDGAGLPIIDTTYSSNPTSAYGSPPAHGGLSGLSGLSGFDDHHSQRAILGLSPLNANVLSVLDAPLPASFDSNAVSHAARYGPWPASVPSKFGLESPTPSLHNAKDERTSETLKLLHSSAFGSSEHLSPSTSLQHDGGAFAGGGLGGLGGPSLGSLGGLGGLGGRGATTTTTTTTSVASALSSLSSAAHAAAPSSSDEYYGKRIMHSSSTRYAKTRLLSSSAPKADRDWDTEFWFLEEDYVPGALANEVLTPQEKARRGSIRLSSSSSNNNNNNNNSNHLAEGGSAFDGLSETPTQSASASANATKFGSPVASSPSRWGPWLQQRQRSSGNGGGAGGSSGSLGAGGMAVGGTSGPGSGDDDFDPGSLGRSMKHAVSAFGHVGSPLRNSSLAASFELNGRDLGGNGPSHGHGHGSSSGSPGSGSLSTLLAGGGSGSRTTGGESMSVLTQQLQRTRLGEDRASFGGSSSSNNNTSGLSSAAVTTAAASGIFGRAGDLRDTRADSGPSPARDRNGGSSSSGLERHISSGSIGSSSASAGRFPAPIDEEDPSFLFDMEEVDDARAAKRKSVGPGSNGAAGALGAPGLPGAAATTAGGSGSMWGYAGIVSAADKSADAANGVPPISR